MASRAWVSAAAVTVQVLMTTNSARWRIGGHRATLIAQLALDGGTIGLGGAAAELFDVKRGHGGRE